MKRVILSLLSILVLYSNSILAQTALEEGTYYIQNAESGEYLSVGAYWGTRSVLALHGIDIKVTKSNNAYTLTTQIQGAGKALRPSDAFMDQSGTWTIEPMTDGTFAMSNGTNYLGYAASDTYPWIPSLAFTNTNGKGTHWRFRTKDELVATLANATADNPIDATFLIQAPDILTGDYRITGTKVWGEDAPVIGGNFAGDNTIRNNANGEKFNLASFNITQTIRDIPNGIYSLSVQGYYRNGSNEKASAAYNNSTDERLTYLYAGDKKSPLPSIYSEAKKGQSGGWAVSTAAGYVPNTQSEAAACFDSGNAYVTTITDIVVVDGALTIGIAKDNKAVEADWTCFDNFTLMYYGYDLSSIKKAALEEIDKYAAKNTDGDEDFAKAIAQQRQAVSDATTGKEVEAALDYVKKAYSIYMTKPEPTDTPIDLTDLVLQNASLTNGTTGWDSMIYNFEGYNQKWAPLTTGNTSVLETYAGYSVQEMSDFSLTQTVALSPGIYRLKGYAFYRYGTSFNSDITGEGKGISCASLIAGDNSVSVMRLGDINASSYANTLTEAAEAFAAGNYLNTLVFELDEASDIRIGFEGSHTRYRSWFVAGPIELEKINQQILAQEAEDGFAAEKLMTSLKWDSYRNIANQAIEHETFDNILNAAKGSLDEIKTQEQLDLKDKEVWDAICNLIKTGTTPTGRFDITSLIENPNLSGNADGWTSTNPLTWDAATGVSEEFFRGSDDINQILPNMPAGSYTLKVQAFYRMAGVSTSNKAYEEGQDKVAAELYLNNASTKIKSINDDARFRSARPWSDIGGAYDKAIPNTLSGAHDAFEAGLYWNILRTETTSDDDIQIGLRFSNGEVANWLAFDNFRLYYGAPTQEVSLSKDSQFSIDEDIYANVTTDIELKAGQYNSICLPFDMDASEFESVWTIAGIEYDSDAQTMMGTLVPAREVKAGVGYLVKVASDRVLKADEVVLRAASPDSIPVIWEGGAISGYYGRSMLIRKYTLDESGTKLEYNGAKLNAPGFQTMVLLPASIQGKVRNIDLKEIDYDNVEININIENIQARAFLEEAKYPSSTATSVIFNYNSCPPSRRDQPHPAKIPVPVSSSTQKLQYSQSSDYSEPVTITIPAGADMTEVVNILPQSHYYYRILSGNTPTSKGEITTEGHLRMIKATSGSNIRDLGGWLTADGNRTRYGLIYRGGEMNGGHQMTDEDIVELRRLGIGAEVDLREDKDIDGYNINASVFGTNAPYIYLNQNIWGDDALENDKVKYKNIFNFILDNLRHDRAVYFHCIWGADRTGATAFLLEGLLGLTRDQMYKDYELTSFSIAGTREKVGLDSKFTYINAISGKTMQMKFFNYWNEQVGISSDDLCEFITRMTEGEPSIVTEINDIKGEEDSNISNANEYYSIDGRRLTKPEPGINIIRKSDGSVVKVIKN